MSETIITSKTLSSVSGALITSSSDSECLSELPPLRAMTEEEIQAAAEGDRDARPRTTSELRNVRRVPRVKTMRQALRLTQEQFAAQFQIPLGTLRDWEQGKSEPDQTAKAYLKAIAGDPGAVFHALQHAKEELIRQ